MCMGPGVGSHFFESCEQVVCRGSKPYCIENQGDVAASACTRPTKARAQTASRCTVARFEPRTGNYSVWQKVQHRFWNTSSNKFPSRTFWEKAPPVAANSEGKNQTVAQKNMKNPSKSLNSKSLYFFCFTQEYAPRRSIRASGFEANFHSLSSPPG